LAGPVPPSCSLILQKRKEKNMSLLFVCLFEIKVVTQGVSWWYFHVYLCHTPISLSPLIIYILP
jgi:hypothetical protein